MRARSAGVDDAFGDTLVVEVEDLLAQDEVFQQRRAAFPGAQAVLVVGDAMAEIVGETGRGVRGRGGRLLVQLDRPPTSGPCDLLV
jgi:hypothetical protein